MNGEMPIQSKGIVPGTAPWELYDTLYQYHRMRQPATVTKSEMFFFKKKFISIMETAV